MTELSRRKYYRLVDDKSVGLDQVPMGLTNYFKLRYLGIASAALILSGVGLYGLRSFLTPDIMTPEKLADLSVKTYAECIGIESVESIVNLEGICYDGNQFLLPRFYRDKQGSIVLEYFSTVEESKGKTPHFFQKPAYVPVRR